MTAGALAAAILVPLNHLMSAATALLDRQALSAVQAALSAVPFTDGALIGQHFPEPILLAPGMMKPVP